MESPPTQSSTPAPEAAALRQELRDLSLVALGAIPGALLRWRMERVEPWLAPPLGDGLGSHALGNLLGSFLLGVVAAGSTPRPRLMLVVGIGFCGSLTTFSGWILELHTLLEAGGAIPALGRLVLSLLGGLLAVTAGALAGRRLSAFRRARGFRR